MTSWEDSAPPHHVHHLNPRVPDCHLRSCHEALRRVVDVPAAGLRQALLPLRLAPWDERTDRLVTFREAMTTEALAGAAQDGWRVDCPPDEFGNTLSIIPLFLRGACELTLFLHRTEAK
jgi:hypothetical protein